jgi:pre-mRNA-processing factor 17
MAVPQDIDVNLLGDSGEQECFIPKKLIHTWDGHAKGVSSIKFFPKSAHLLLSGGMDNQVKVCIILAEKKLRREPIRLTLLNM